MPNTSLFKMLRQSLWEHSLEQQSQRDLSSFDETYMEWKTYEVIGSQESIEARTWARMLLAQ